MERQRPTALEYSRRLSGRGGTGQGSGEASSEQGGLGRGSSAPGDRPHGLNQKPQSCRLV